VDQQIGGGVGLHADEDAEAEDEEALIDAESDCEVRKYVVALLDVYVLHLLHCFKIRISQTSRMDHQPAKMPKDEEKSLTLGKMKSAKKLTIMEIQRAVKMNKIRCRQ
jgi:hypothetical protein